ncbi:MAG: hypothetical protein ACRDNS_14680 [Trebonia sp.]
MEVLAGTIDLEACVSRREGDERLYRTLTRFLVERDLVDLDRSFTEAFVTNPGAGEIVKGHAIVLAELGLLPFHGTVIRDPGLFDGKWSRARRAEHLLARMAFCQELCAALIPKTLSMYRGAALDIDQPTRIRGASSFVSFTFSEQVAAAHFAGGPRTHTAVMWRQLLDPGRVLMTFLETAAMNGRFKEAEAVLIADPTSPRCLGLPGSI